MVAVLCTILRTYFKAILFGLAAFFYPQLNVVPPGTSHGAIRDHYDMVVISGSGPACIVAKEMSKTHSVLLIVEGPGENAESRAPALYTLQENTPLTSNYTTVKQHSSCRNTKGICEYYQATGLGGQSSINDLMIARANRKDFEYWEGAGHEWEYSKILAAYKKLENVIIKDLHSPLRGTKGPLKIDYSQYKSPITDKLILGAIKLGLKNRDYNGKYQIAVSRPQLASSGIARLSVSEAFLQGSKNTNLDIVYDAVVDKVLIEDKKACGVRFKVGKVVKEVEAKKGVVVAANAVSTTGILQRSGVGPAHVLHKLGIEVKADLPVGENLEDQISVSMAWKLKDYSVLSPAEEATVCNAIDFTVKKTGPLGYNKLPVVAFINTQHPGRTDCRANLQMKFREGVGTNSHQMVVEVILLRPTSKGYVKVRSANPHDPPIINPGFEGKREDIKALKDGLEFAHKILRTHYLEKYHPVLDRSFAPLCKHVEREHEFFECVAREYNKPLGRAVGVARLGSEEDRTAVVTPTLGVIGIQHLYVCGRSMMRQISADPLLTNLVTGYRLVDFLREECNSNLKTKRHTNNTNAHP